MADLKELLGEDLYSQIVEKIGDHKIAIVSDGNWIPREKFNEVNESRKQAEAALKERDQQLEELKKASEGNAELLKQIEQLQQENKSKEDEYRLKIRDMAVNTAIKLAIAGQAHDPDLVAELVDVGKLEVDDDGNIKKGLDDVIKELREAKPFLFKTEGAAFKGVTPAEGSEKQTTLKNPWSKEHFNLTEQARILRENPDLAKQLQSQIQGG